MPSKGVNSTEFWMFVACGLFLILNGTPLIEVPQEQVTAWMGMTGLYGGIRTLEKVVAHSAAAKRGEAAPPSGRQEGTQA